MLGQTKLSGVCLLLKVKVKESSRRELISDRTIKAGLNADMHSDH